MNVVYGWNKFPVCNMTVGHLPVLMVWKLHEPGDIKDWDGMMGWFMDYVSKNKHVLEDEYIAKWHKAALICLF